MPKPPKKIRCPHCGKLKTIAEMGTFKTISGTVRVRAWCKQCRTAPSVRRPS